MRQWLAPANAVQLAWNEEVVWAVAALAVGVPCVVAVPLPELALVPFVPPFAFSARTRKKYAVPPDRPVAVYVVTLPTSLSWKPLTNDAKLNTVETSRRYFVAAGVFAVQLASN